MAGYGQSLALSEGVSCQRGAPLRPAYSVMVPHCGEKRARLQGFLFPCLSSCRASPTPSTLALTRGAPESLDPAEQATYDPGASIITCSWVSQPGPSAPTGGM